MNPTKAQRTKNVLNTYANMPMGVVIITDRLNVRCYFLPDKSWEEARYDSKVITDFAEGVSDPELKLRVRFDNKDNETDFEDAVAIRLRELKRRRPPVHPIDMVVSIDEFFSTTALNQFVRKWLLQDLRLIFSF